MEHFTLKSSYGFTWYFSTGAFTVCTCVYFWIVILILQFGGLSFWNGYWFAIRHAFWFAISYSFIVAIRKAFSFRFYFCRSAIFALRVATKSPLAISISSLVSMTRSFTTHFWNKQKQIDQQQKKNKIGWGAIHKLRHTKRVGWRFNLVLRQGIEALKRRGKSRKTSQLALSPCERSE